MENRDTPLHELPQYLHGQILALQALVLALARITTADPTEFREAGTQALERLRTSMLPQPVSEAQLVAVDQMQAWLAQVTDATPPR